jgi:small GTP-binding protein
MNNTKIIKKKICLLGSFGVGKTSLVRRFVYNLFDDQYLSTIGVKVSQKLLPQDKEIGMQFNFLIWDLEGFEQSSAITKNYYTGASAAIVVADLTRIDTIETLPKNIIPFKKVNPNAIVLIAGNKNDLVQNELTAKNTLIKIANQEDIPYYFTSALNGENVENCFITLSKLLANFQ